VQIPKTETKYGETPLLYTSTVHGHDDSVTIFALNISKEDLMVDIDLASFGRLSMTEHICLNGNDLNAKNTFEHPDCVSPREITPVRGEFSKCSILLPKQSWNVLRFKIAS
jgi:alpha-N-arabinofuranosidase